MPQEGAFMERLFALRLTPVSTAIEGTARPTLEVVG